MTVNSELEFFQKLSLEAARAGAQISLPAFSKNLSFERKADSSPVTEADRQAENAMRQVLREKFPTHRIRGEEFEEEGPSQSPFVWHIDPIDGTLMFMRQIPFWGSVIGLEYEGEIIAGSLMFPALNLEMSAALGQGCWLNGKRVQASSRERLDESLIIINCFQSLPLAEQRQLLEITQAFLDARFFGDCYAHLLLASGKAEVVIDAKVSPYDIAGSQICIRESGGRMTNWNNELDIYSARTLASNGRLHEASLQAIQKTFGSKLI